MGIRRSQVEKIKNARREFVRVERKGTRQERARANAVLNRLIVNSSEDEHDQAYRENL